MKIYTIPRRDGGNIHDIASSDHERDIKFREGTKFAVVYASYYNAGYTTHRTEEAAAAQSRRLNRDDYSHAVIDARGDSYYVDGDVLRSEAGRW